MVILYFVAIQGYPRVFCWLLVGMYGKAMHLDATCMDGGTTSKTQMNPVTSQPRTSTKQRTLIRKEVGGYYKPHFDK